MQTRQPPSRKDDLPRNQALAWFIGSLTMFVAPVGYWLLGGSTLFGQSGVKNLLIISGIGGIFSFAFWGGRSRWLIGGLLGLLSGLGSAGAYVYYTGLFHKTVMFDKECLLVCLAGGGLPLALFLFILKRDKNKLPKVRRFTVNEQGETKVTYK